KAPAFPDTDSGRKRGDETFFEAENFSFEVISEMRGEFPPVTFEMRQAIGIEWIVIRAVEIDRDEDFPSAPARAKRGTEQRGRQITVAHSSGELGGNSDSRI